MRNIGIYIHIPFCLTKCKYCDFNSYTGKEDMQRDYLFALVSEIKQYSYKLRDCVVDTIYIGGGTPSILFAGGISTILAEVRKSYNVAEDAEISIEANPNSITLSKAMEWKSVGINRVSVGLQTTNASALKLIGRSHNKKDYINAIKILQNAGFSNINTDLMIGLPKQKSSDVKYAITLSSKLGCTHISCYSLILEENTPLHRLVSDGVVKLPKEEKTIGMYITANNTLAKLGYSRYEVSNFALQGYECKHNFNCWSMQEYIGFGAGAHSFVDNVRYSNAIGIEEYINLMRSKSNPIVSSQKCDKISLYEECVMLGFRKTEGVKIAMLDKYLGESFKVKYKDTIDKYLSLGLINITKDYIRATEDGMFVLNQLILDFTL